jgi:hypothetical protein
MTTYSTELDEFKKLLECAFPSDFNGHTEFESLTPEQRLQWLSQCVEFMNEVKSRHIDAIQPIVEKPKHRG